MIEAEEDSILGYAGQSALPGWREAWLEYQTMMRRLAVPVLISLLLAGALGASFADEAPPLEAVWHLPASVIGDPSLPAGIASGSDGSVYVVEVGVNRVQKFDSDGRLLERWGAPQGQAGNLEKPFGVAVGPDDSVYVTEMGRAQVRHFDAQGEELGAWGGFGVQHGRFREVRGIAVSAESQVYVVDGQNRRVQCFNAKGRFLSAWGEDVLESPIDVAVTPAGDVLVTDVGCRCVHRFTGQGRWLASWRPTDGFRAFDFWPQGVAVASDGSVFVCDPGAGQVLEFSSEGLFLRRWPDPSARPGSFRIVPTRRLREIMWPLADRNASADRLELRTPLSVGVDPAQRLLVLDRGLAQVRIYKH